MQTIEAAEALLNMDSPGPMLDEKRPSEFEDEAEQNRLCVNTKMKEILGSCER